MRDDHHSTEALMAIIFAACVLMALVLLTACGAHEAPAAEAKPTVEGQTVVFPPKSPLPERLLVDRVQPPMERQLQLPGRLVWDEERTVRVFSPFAGRVTRLLARPGDRVTAGQPLAQLTSADFGQAQAEARKAEVDVALARKALDRAKELQAHGVASLKDLQQAEAEYARARAEADRAATRLASYGHASSGTDFVLRSPVAGTVVERNLNPGQELRPDQPGAPLFVVTDPARLWVQLDASEADARLLKPGMSMVIASTQFPEDAFAGELRQVSDFVDPTSRTVKLRGEVPNPERTLKGEMFVTARVKVPAGELPTVDARAVFLSGVRRFAFVRESPERFTRRALRVGPEVDGRMPVMAGLREGENVVVSGGLFLEQIVSTARPPESGTVAAKAP